MKKLFFLFAATLMSYTVFAQQPYVCTEEGTIMEYTTLNAKGKAEGPVSVETIASVKKVGATTEVVTNLEFDGMPISKPFTIKGGNVIIPKEALLPFPIDEIKAQGMDVDVQGDDIVYPVNIAVGKELPECTISIMITAMEAFQMLDMTIKNRKCVAEEEVTVPAGTFKCVVIEETQTQTVTFKGQQQSETSKTKTWYAEGVGTVKEETYTNRGKLQSTKELTKLTKPEKTEQAE